jgi:heparosan-N-sulfate-glucuronate 5-epimerase
MPPAAPVQLFRQGNPHAGYYLDLRSKACGAGSPDAALTRLRRLTANRLHSNPVTIAQLGLGAWQLGETWREVQAATAVWLVEEMDVRGYLPYLFAMPHTYELEPPWVSAMAQGETASLLIRAARTLGEPEFRTKAVQAAASLLKPDSPLVFSTPEGPVLEEYPTDPPAHVLNGWISALWGLYDVAAELREHTGEGGPYEAAFTAGAACLASRLPAYALSFHWSRYDVYPHRLVNIASPAYHSLHIQQLQAMAVLTSDATFARVAADWTLGLKDPFTRGLAVTRKIGFRLVGPRLPLARRLAHR